MFKELEMSQVKPISPGAVDIQDENSATPDYVKAKSGRVFVATPAIVKQFRKGKFGMIEITKEQYDDAIAKEAKGSGSASSTATEKNEELAKENAELKAKVEAMEKAAAKPAAKTTAKPAAKTTSTTNE